MSPRKIFLFSSLVAVLLIAGVASVWRPALWAYVIAGPVILLGLSDMLQRSRTVIRNFPVIGHARYWMEAIRPEIQQYFVESDTSGRPFSREYRSVVYQRAKNTTDTRPFGTIRDLYEVGTEWIAHSLHPTHPPETPPRILIGGTRCEQPYHASLLNVSAMSFGSLSMNAILALNTGARLGGFAHNTGEGGISPYHLEPGGDLIWQVGTGYFGCRTSNGQFDPELFARKARHDSVKMIEIKLSQGAKPGHGGILPGAKVTPQIAEIRGVPVGEDVISPPAHSAFSTPSELLEFVVKLRELSGGKPVGFKLCIGRRREFLSICKAMAANRSVPDFITVDGAEGGTGAAPMEFSNAIGTPLTEGLLFVHNALVGCGLREETRIICSARIVTGFHMVRRMAMGADLCNSARAMMFAIGCIQALKCNTNACPVGVATQDPGLYRGLNVPNKAQRVFNYHRNTIKSTLEILGAAGLAHPSELRPHHIQRRVSPTKVEDYATIYERIEPGSLLGESPPSTYASEWKAASAQQF
ncbi:MAG: FMN-binding glutamate synthase family protein [Planctomycetes bacterium]|nr:FMN-binding glutamate synthase family protein [Planctomycetota bacterium]